MTPHLKEHHNADQDRCEVISSKVCPSSSHVDSSCQLEFALHTFLGAFLGSRPAYRAEDADLIAAEIEDWPW